jgi:hypothetical protein
MGFTTLYDVTRFPGGAAMFVVCAGVAAGAAFFANRAWRALRGTNLQSVRRQAGPDLAGLLLGATAALALSIYLCWWAVWLGVWTFDYRVGRYEVLEGCTHDFAERRTALQTLGSFSIGKKRFSFTESGWPWGSSQIDRAGKYVDPNVHLRVFISRKTLRRVDDLHDDCDG